MSMDAAEGAAVEGAAVDDAAAYERLERARWSADPPPCPHCAAGGAYLLRPRDGATRATRTGARSARRVWKCRVCRRQFSVLTGTVLAGSRVPARALVAVLFAWTTGGRAAGRTAAAAHGLTGEAARHLLRRLEAAAAEVSGTEVSGTEVSGTEVNGTEVGADGLLRAVLGGADADTIRWNTPARRRPRRQAGPTADHGSG